MSHSSNSSDTASDPLDLKDDEGWEDAEPDVESVQVVGLFDDKTFPDAKAMIEDCKQRYQFDFIDVQKRLGLDFLSSVKLVNYIRSQAKEGHTKPDVSSKSVFEDDKYLQPVLEDDAFLFGLDELEDSTEEPANDAVSGPANDATRVQELESELKKMQEQFTAYQEAVSRTLEQRWNERDDAAGPSGSKDTKESNAEGGYFDSYGYNDIHETMLKDSVRTDGYRDFIYDNKHLFAGKTVLDIGCGTGILSMFAAKAGAAKVIAVDNSSIIDKAVINVHANGLSDKITCLRGKIEEVTLPVDKVDIIVSEWMGYCLLYEAMFDSVLWARDRYLKDTGLMVPSHTTLHIAPFADEDYVSDTVDFWRDVYGFNMTAMMDKIVEDIRVKSLAPSKLAGKSSQFVQLPLHTVTLQDLVFIRNFSVELEKDIDALDGWCIWFDTFFLPSRDMVLLPDARAEEWDASKPGNAFTTGPGGKPTHWESGLLLLEGAKKGGSLKKGQKISGQVEYVKKGENSRLLEIGVDWEVEGAGKEKQTWKLS
ncbi:ribosomal protein arginine N-methytransferase rmt3 [Saccharata proteae CBS 121410]|uniref:type I protein arginine methyltransferase n=1 Tax=Saccharata proteae CBS 121410 TaxID=1314787 RepID=A0A9P4I1K2_9PEZI|nr:ribosomal protein arginine N-methytransferase rmt3 [Saccharata proteae CBS 121410]